jgi:hypothetical protein
MKVFLLITLLWPGMVTKEIKYEFSTMEECRSVLSDTIIHTPNSADENEWIGVATCVYQ